MCGRFRLTRPWREIHDLYRLTAEAAPNLAPRRNIAPSQSLLAVRHDAGGRRVPVDLRWGFVPSWAPDAKRAQINARAEGVLDRPMFRDAFAKRRCIVVADGYYEWETQGKAKLPWLFTIGDSELFAFAGIWERWTKGPDGAIETVALMTTAPNDFCAEVHDRMPVILDRDELAAWLDPATPVDDAKALLDSYPADRMAKRRVSTKLNSARYDADGIDGEPVDP